MSHGSIGTAPLLSVVSSEKNSQEKHYIHCTIDIMVNAIIMKIYSESVVYYI